MRVSIGWIKSFRGKLDMLAHELRVEYEAESEPTGEAIMYGIATALTVARAEVDRLELYASRQRAHSPAPAELRVVCQEGPGGVPCSTCKMMPAGAWQCGTWPAQPPPGSTVGPCVRERGHEGDHVSHRGSWQS